MTKQISRLARHVNLNTLTGNGPHRIDQRNILPIPLQLGVKKKWCCTQVEVKGEVEELACSIESITSRGVVKIKLSFVENISDLARQLAFDVARRILQ